MDPSTLCKLVFLGGGIACLTGSLYPPLLDSVFRYGSRLPTTPEAHKAHSSRTEAWIRTIGRLQVPHSWFIHYYVVSLLSSLFWAQQYLTKGSCLEALAVTSKPRLHSMTILQVHLAWSLLAVQGMRRCYECLNIHKPSSSQMSVSVWLVGCAFYLFDGVAVWIDGIDVAWSGQDARQRGLSDQPWLKIFLGTTCFLVGSVCQHVSHKHLASLKKYSLPNHALFRHALCPHYASECLIYLGIAITAAPETQVLNRTVLSTLFFVVANLAVTADATKKSYAKRFGAPAVDHRWRMIPGLY